MQQQQADRQHLNAMHLRPQIVLCCSGEISCKPAFMELRPCLGLDRMTVHMHRGIIVLSILSHVYSTLTALKHTSPLRMLMQSNVTISQKHSDGVLQLVMCPFGNGSVWKASGGIFPVKSKQLRRGCQQLTNRQETSVGPFLSHITTMPRAQLVAVILSWHLYCYAHATGCRQSFPPSRVVVSPEQAGVMAFQYIAMLSTFVAAGHAGSSDFAEMLVEFLLAGCRSYLMTSNFTEASTA